MPRAERASPAANRSWAPERPTGATPSKSGAATHRAPPRPLALGRPLLGPLALVFAALTALVVLFGGVYLSAQVSAEALLLAALAWACLQGGLVDTNWRIYAVAGFLLGVPLVQLLPLPAGLLDLVDQPLAQAVRAAAALGLRHGLSASVSMDPQATLRHLVWVAALVIIYLLVRTVARTEPAATDWLVSGLLVLAATVALYGIYEWHSAMPHILWRPRQYYLGDVSGTFINKNSFAGMVELTFPYALARLLRPKGRSRWAQRAPELLIAFVLLVGAVASHSRMGLISLAFGTLALLAARFGRSPRRLGIALGLLLLACGGLLRLAGWHNLTQGFAAMDASDSYGSGGRLATWRATLPLVPQHWLLGTGLGTWEDATNGYFVEGVFQYAHNDYLEFAMAGGVLFAAVIAGLLVSGAWRGLRKAPEPVALGAGAALASIALHSLADFNLQIPANAALATVALALTSAALRRRSKFRPMMARPPQS